MSMLNSLYVCVSVYMWQWVYVCTSTTIHVYKFHFLILFTWICVGMEAYNIDNCMNTYFNLHLNKPSLRPYTCYSIMCFLSVIIQLTRFVDNCYAFVKFRHICIHTYIHTYKYVYICVELYRYIYVCLDICVISYVCLDG